MFGVIDPASVTEFGELNDELLSSKVLLDAVNQDLKRLAKDNDLQPQERPKRIKLIKSAWTEKDLLTPTMKVKRNVAREFYKSEIEELYS
jgi:long-chain acyl-CoA synthetase